MSQVEKIVIGGASVYITSDANLQWDSVIMEITTGTRAFTLAGSSQEAYELANAIIKASEAAATKRRERMRPSNG